MPIRITDIDHIVLPVEDIDLAIAFYCQVLGCTIDRERPELGLYHLRAGRAFIDLLDITKRQAPEPVGAAPVTAPNLDHFALRIDNFDEPAIRAHLEQHGIAAGEAVERYGARGNGPSLYIKDPDGNTVELKGPSSS